MRGAGGFIFYRSGKFDGFFEWGAVGTAVVNVAIVF